MQFLMPRSTRWYVLSFTASYSDLVNPKLDNWLSDETKQASAVVIIMLLA